MESPIEVTGRSAGSIFPKASQNALRIPEVLSSVLAESGPTLETCAAAARVCNLWFECAANYMWRDLNTPVPLLELLSPLVSVNSSPLRFTSPGISVQAWKRLKKYSSRVRRLSYSDRVTDLDSTVLHNVGLSRPELYILPLLSSLELELHTATAFTNSLIFFTPTITELSFTAGPNPIAVTAIQRLCLLKKLDITGLFTVDDSSLNELLSQLTHLESVNIEFLPSNTNPLFDTLSKLPGLQSLDLTFNAVDPPPIFQPISKQPKGASFPRLERLSLTGMDVWSTANLLIAYPLQLLTRLALFVLPNEVHASQEAQTRLFTTIAEVSPVLAHLDVQFDDDGHETLLDFATIKAPLTQLPLRRVMITHRSPLKLTEEDVFEIAQSLGPTIEDLTLNAYPSEFPQGHLYLTLNALIPLAQYCPKLRELTILVEAVIGKEQLPDIPAQFSPSLWRIDFGESGIPDLSPVVDFLWKIGCPSIYVESELVDDGFRTSWLVVQKVLEKLHEFQKASEEKLQNSLRVAEQKFEMRIRELELKLEGANGGTERR